MSVPSTASRKAPNVLVIDSDECIDSAVCVPTCPVEAIYADDDLSADHKLFLALNAELAKL